MDFITEPSIQEVFFYFLIMVGMITVLVSAFLSPLILALIIRASRGRIE